MITREEIIEYLEKTCGSDRQFMLNFRGWDYEKILQYGDFKPTDSVLDTGALHTYFSIYLSTLVKEILVTDSFDWAKRDYFTKPNAIYGGKILPTIDEWTRCVEVGGKGKVMVDIADATDLQYPDNTFDKVLSISTIEHILNDRLGITEMMRVLKPGGSLLITTEYNTDKPMEYDPESFMRVYDDKKLYALIEGFNFKEIEILPPDGFLPWTTLFIRLTK
jgi:SAM-dependent methyltransferase